MGQLPLSIQTATFQAALAEAMAHSKYGIMSAICKEQGYHSISMLLDQLASNEKEHLELLLKKLNMLPGNVEAILKTVLLSELNDGNNIYPKLVTLIGDDKESNRAMGDLQDLAMRLGMIERHHAKLIDHACKALGDPENVEEPKAMWVCSHCGNTYENFDDIPEKCPVCEHSRADYVLAY